MLIPFSVPAHLELAQVNELIKSVQRGRTEIVFVLDGISSLSADLMWQNFYRSNNLEKFRRRSAFLENDSKDFVELTGSVSKPTNARPLPRPPDSLPFPPPPPSISRARRATTTAAASTGRVSRWPT
jgi:hypothetical protein